jgi:hypothetical protein
MIATWSRVLDQHPEDVATLHDMVIDQLNLGPHGNFPDAWAHVGDHVRDIFPVLMEDSRLEPVQTRLLDAYARMPHTADTRLRQSPGENSIGLAAGIGGVVLLIVVAGTVAYCLGGPDPEPGQSVEARC